MTLAKRVVPVVLVRGKTAYKGPGFGPDCARSVGSAMSLCRTHAQRGVDEIVLLDISATAEGRGPNLSLITELSTDCYIPITVGGGVNTLQDIDALLRAGADKVAIGAALWPENYEGLLRSAAERFGRQALVAIVDVRIATRKIAAVEAAWREAEGAGEILLQSVDRDGTMQGYDLDLIREVSQSVSIPVIASGGCSGYEDMLNAFKAGADACAAGALFSFTDCVPKGAAKFLKAHGLEVRL